MMARTWVGAPAGVRSGGPEWVARAAGAAPMSLGIRKSMRVSLWKLPEPGLSLHKDRMSPESQILIPVRMCGARSAHRDSAELSTESVNNRAILWINPEPGGECCAVASPSHRGGLGTRRCRHQLQ